MLWSGFHDISSIYISIQKQYCDAIKSMDNTQKKALIHASTIVASQPDLNTIIPHIIDVVSSDTN